MVRLGKSGSLHMRQVKYFMETGKYQSSVLLQERNGIKKAAKKFMIQNNEMYYIGMDGKEKRLVLFSDTEIESAFAHCHVSKKSGEHIGRTRTLALLKEKYYWTSMVEDTVSLMVQCKVCQFNKLNKKESRYIRVTVPWEIVSVDILGQFPTSDCGHVFVAVFIDMFSKYTIVVPLKDTTVTDVASAIENSVCQLGVPHKILSDQSEEYVRQLNIVLELDKGLPKNVLSINKSHINRPDEAAIKLEILNFCNNKESLWAACLHKKTFEINTMFSTSGGHKPFFLMFNRPHKPDSSVNNEVTTHPKPFFVVRDIERYLIERDDKMKDIAKEVSADHQPQETSTLNSETPSNEDVSDFATDREENVVGNLTATELYPPIEVKTDHGYPRICEGVSSIQCDAKGQGNFTQLIQVTNEAMISNESESVYNMADGEGQVVVMADDICGTSDGTDMVGQHMVIVQPGLDDQSLIMLRENKVIMHSVKAQEFNAFQHQM